MKQSNILDPVHSGLSSLVWDDPDGTHPKLKKQHNNWIKRTVYGALSEAGYTHIDQWLRMFLTGSLTTYQYSDLSDCDVSLFVDVEKFPDWSRGEMIGIMVGKVDGTTLPGTPFPMQDFVVGRDVKPTDIYKPGLRSGYSLDTDGWINPPERERVHDVQTEQNGFYVTALLAADKMERLLRYEPDKAVMYWHQIHKKRMRDQQAGRGDFTESNIIYKFLSQRGLFPQIAETSGEYIAKVAKPSKNEMHVACYLPPKAAKEIYTWVSKQDWPKGVELEKPEDYHVTVFYSDNSQEQRDENWISHRKFKLRTESLEVFPSEKDSAIVLRVDGEGIKKHIEQQIKAAERNGVDPNRFGGHKPHITIAYGPEIDVKDYEVPKLSFETEKAVVSEPRVAGTAPEPPNYKEGTEAKHCSNCKMYDDGKCWGYGNKEVGADDVCDSWAAEITSKTANLEVQELGPGRDGPVIYDPDYHRMWFGGPHSAHYNMIEHIVGTPSDFPHQEYPNYEYGQVRGNNVTWYSPGFEAEEAVNHEAGLSPVDYDSWDFTSKTAAWQDWTNHIQPIAQAYEALPTYDPQAALAWKELADNSMRRAQEIGQRLNVQETDNPEPYANHQEMFDDINRGNFQVSRANSEHPIWTPEQNVAFRTVHDVEGHHPTGGDFSWAGENQACGAHAASLSPLAQKALMTECLGQTGWAIQNGGFGPQKVGYMNVNPQTFSSSVPEGGFCHRHIRHGIYKLPHTAKTAAPRQIAKFVYSPIDNKLVLGEMGREEGEKPNHFELANANFPRESFPSLAFGHVNPDGFVDTYGRPRISLGESQMNPYQAQWLTEEALRRAVPHARFLHPEPQHDPNWALSSEPEVVYTGEPPELDKSMQGV